MIAAYSRPADGFMSIEPIADLGGDSAVALWKAGVRSGDPIRAAKGRAILVMTPSGPKAVRISASDLQAARQEAIRSLPMGEVTLLEATFRGRYTVFRRVEVLNALTPAEAAKEDHLHLVAPNGVLIAKTLSPANPVDAKHISERLGSQLRHAERVAFQPKLDAYVKKMKVDWGSLNADQTARHLAKIRTDLHAMLKGVANKAMPTWNQSVTSTLESVHKGTRKVLKNNFIPSVGISLRQPDLRAVQAIADQQGFWMRDAYGYRSELLTNQARGIIQDGVKRGLGRNEIGRTMQKALPKAWQAMGKRYFNTVAANAVSRGRSYSEVSGYLEVGIEALEVQAVMDERTTDTCACLDGQIIETHVVSQQIVGAMNVSDPEDIRDASPFLKESFNAKTGMKEIVTANNGSKIAEVVRSGAGRVDDKGMYNYYRQGNQLAEVNIGPPPYHHMCRSWTVPVTTTVSVPRGKIPQAMGPATPPLAKPPPKRGSPFRPTPSRPIEAVPKGTPQHPATVGDPDLIERYPFTEDFLLPPPLPAGKVIGGSVKNAAGYFQKYQFDISTRSIRAVGKMNPVSVPSGVDLYAGKHKLHRLVDKMKLTADTSGVVLHVDQIGFPTIRQVVLEESQAVAANRVYTMRSQTTGKSQYLKFNPDRKRTAKDALKKLNKATTDAEIKVALKDLRKTGYVRRETSWEKINYGDPAPTLKPMPKPKAKPKPKPKKKPKPLYEPTLQPKPKPTVHEVSPIGRIKPKPKPKKKPAGGFEETVPTSPPIMTEPRLNTRSTYEEYGLLGAQTASLDQQVIYRSRFETKRIKDAMNAIEAKLPPIISTSIKERRMAQGLQDFIAADTGAVEHISAKTVREFTKKAAKKDVAQALQGVKDSTGRGMMRLHPGKTVEDISLKKVADTEVAELMNETFKNLSQRVMDASKHKGFPRVYRAKNVSEGAFYREHSNIIVIPETATVSMESIFKHEWNHFVDTVSWKFTGQAGQTFLSQNATSKKVLRGPQGWEYKPGKWGDEYVGRIYDKDWASEVHTMFAEVLDKSRLDDLWRMYKANPEHAGQFMAQAKGAYIP